MVRTCRPLVDCSQPACRPVADLGFGIPVEHQAGHQRPHMGVFGACNRWATPAKAGPRHCFHLPAVSTKEICSLAVNTCRLIVYAVERESIFLLAQLVSRRMRWPATARNHNLGQTHLPISHSWPLPWSPLHSWRPCRCPHRAMQCCPQRSAHACSAPWLRKRAWPGRKR